MTLWQERAAAVSAAVVAVLASGAKSQRPFVIGAMVLAVALPEAVAAPSQEPRSGVLDASALRGKVVAQRMRRDTAELELAFWNAIKDSSNPAEYRAYLESFPEGVFAPLARIRAGHSVLDPRSTDRVEEVERIHEVLLNANVRQGPSSETSRVGSVREGEQVTVTGLAAGGSWLRITTGDGTEGFLFAELARQVSAAAIVEATPVQQAGDDQPAAAIIEAIPVPPTRDAQIAAIRPQAPLPTNVFRDCEICPEMVRVRAGRFVMGDDRGEKAERPAHPVTLRKDYAIGRFEITVAEWKACVAGGGCPVVPDLDEFQDSTPVRNVSWDDANGYARWLSQSTGQQYRLPTEAEWEFAARGATRTRYWWGDDVSVGKVSCRECDGAWSRDKPLPVGTLEPNPFGLFDVNGSIAEWTADCWQASYAGAPGDGSAVDKKNCRQRVLRGGSWRSSSTTFLTSASRFFYDANVRYVANGFRVARD